MGHPQEQYGCLEDVLLLRKVVIDLMKVIVCGLWAVAEYNTWIRAFATPEAGRWLPAILVHGREGVSVGQCP